MKYIAILKAHPGIEAQKEAIDLFTKIGSHPSVNGSLVSYDGQTSYHFGDSDDLPIAYNAAYAPYFDMEIVPVVDMDEAWLTAFMEGMAMRD